MNSFVPVIYLLYVLLAPAKHVQNDHKNWEQKIPIEYDASVAGREIVVLQHVQDMRKPRTPAKDELHQNEGKPVGLIPKTEKTDQPNADGCEA